MNVEFPERFRMSDYFLYHNVEEGRENKTCLYYRDESYTYADAVRLSNRAGGALRELGLRVEVSLVPMEKEAWVASDVQPEVDERVPT